MIEMAIMRHHHTSSLHLLMGDLLYGTWPIEIDDKHDLYSHSKL